MSQQGSRVTPRLRLHHRIVIPFIFVAVVTTSAVAAVAVSLIRHALESRVFTQLHNTSEVLARTDFALNVAILQTAKQITGADVITLTGAGSIVASTVADAQARPLLAAGGGPSALRAALVNGGEPVMLTGDCSGMPCYIAYRRVSARPDTVVAVVVRTAEVRSATAAIARALVISAAVALIVMVLVSEFVARRVTAPIEELIAFTRDAAPGASQRRARVGSDEVGGLATAFNDMLDRLDRAQDAVVRSEKLAVAGLLAARVAHDIRNPLSSIKMQTQLLRARLTGADERPLVDAVLHDVDQVESVIRGLLELARPGALKLAPASLNDVIAQLLERLRPQFAHRKVAVAAHFDESLPIGQFDAARLEQAVLNVVLNGAEAMPYGGTLTVTTRSERAGASARLEVCDDGVGVAPEILDRLFDPFVSTKRDGVGLGLVNTKAVVESHGGRIEIAPGSPKGTVVRITLPISPPLAATETRHG
jgi:signal transduction histidine kinase